MWQVQKFTGTGGEIMAWNGTVTLGALYTGGGLKTACGLTRICFQRHIIPANIPSFITKHQNLSDGIQKSLADAGWYNYATFCREADGLVITYAETKAETYTEAVESLKKSNFEKLYSAEFGLDATTIESELKHYFYLGSNQEGQESTTATNKTWEPQASTAPATTSNGLNRVCFHMKFEAQDLAQYLKDHETVWPEMQKALVETGWHNYSLFYREDGFAVGYFETDAGFKEACERMDHKEVNKIWQDAMSKYTPSKSTPLDAAGPLTPVCYIGNDK
eukprot:m.86839 g.86839  ORF g.86839 m.86839 type:complete len:277 (+) comp13073_c0_seq6:190-1020(+)